MHLRRAGPLPVFGQYGHIGIERHAPIKGIFRRLRFIGKRKGREKISVRQKQESASVKIFSRMRLIFFTS